jgi:ferredoxin-like protein FixX
MNIKSIKMDQGNTFVKINCYICLLDKTVSIAESNKYFRFCNGFNCKLICTKCAISCYKAREEDDLEPFDLCPNCKTCRVLRARQGTPFKRHLLQRIEELIKDDELFININAKGKKIEIE